MPKTKPQPTEESEATPPDEPNVQRRTVDANRVAQKLAVRVADLEGLNAQLEVLIEDLQAESRQLREALIDKSEARSGD